MQINVFLKVDAFEAKVNGWQTAAIRLEHDVIENTVGEAVDLGAEHARQLHSYRDRSEDGLTKSIRGFMVSDDEGVIEATKPYASLVEDGTPEHEILPVHRKVLHWFDDDGEEHFAMAVDHPGTEPMPFIKPAAEGAEKYITKMVDQRLAKGLRAIINGRAGG